MKIKTERPIRQFEDSDEVVELHPTTPHVNAQAEMLANMRNREITDALVAAERFKAASKRGFGVRAVVSKFKHELPTDAMVDPTNWGIIISVDPFRYQLFLVGWLDGTTTRSDSFDLGLIYNSQSTSAIKSWLSAMSSTSTRQ